VYLSIKVVAKVAMSSKVELDPFSIELCCFIMMVRGHVKKMPMNILISHAAVKFYRGLIKTV
jgi:hypothetical protein